MLHYFARSFFAPLLPVSVEDDGALVIYVVSDLSADLKLRVVVRFSEHFHIESAETVLISRKCLLLSSPTLMFKHLKQEIFKHSVGETRVFTSNLRKIII